MVILSNHLNQNSNDYCFCYLLQLICIWIEFHPSPLNFWLSNLTSFCKFSAQHVWRYQKKSEIILWNVPLEKNWSYEHILSKILIFYGSLYYKINLLGGFLYFQNMTLTVHPCINYNLRLNLFLSIWCATYLLNNNYNLI